MPRFFFDHVGSNEEFDAEGLEFPDLAEATEGAQAAADVAAGSLPHRRSRALGESL